LTVTATGVNKTYDGTTNSTVALSDNKFSGDTVTDNSTAASFANKNIGTNKTVSVSGISISGASAANYTLSSTTVSTTANISSRALTVSATGVNRVFNDTTNATVTLSDNRVFGDIFSDSYTNANFTDKNVGTGKTVNVSGISISGADAGNYNFNATTATIADITPASTTNAVSVSANPSPTGSNVTLTATLAAVAPGAGTPTGTAQFLADGSPVGSPAALSGGIASLTTASLTHGNHTIAAQYVGDTNFFGSTNNFASTLLINSTPTTGTFTLNATKNMAANLSAVKLANAGKDADHDALSITAVNAASAQGGTVSLVSGTITYTPPTDYVGSDSFTYTIADTFGATASGTVLITVTTSTSGNPTYNMTGTVISGGSITLRGASIPNRTNIVQRTTSISPPITWTPIGTNVAGANGLWQFTDPAPSNPAFYRSVTQ